ncbi:hypothetical protein Tco_0985808 [Tanacetum coccineum]
MFDESLNPSPYIDLQAPEVIAPIPEAVAPEHAVSTVHLPSTTVDQDAPFTPSNSHTTQETQTPIISHDVEEDNHDIEVAHMGNDPYFGIPIPEVTSDQSSSSTYSYNCASRSPMDLPCWRIQTGLRIKKGKNVDPLTIVVYWHPPLSTQTPIISHDVEEDNHDIEVAHMGNDPYFGIPIPEVNSDQSSSSDVIHTIVPPDHQVSEHNSKWTKDHPLVNIIVEPKNYKDALTQACWIEAMQEELHEFECLEVWELVPPPDKAFVISLKWIYKVKLDELGGILKNKEHVENGVIELYFVNTGYQLADIFTKALGRERIEFLINKLGMRSFTPDTLKQLADEVDE